MRLENCFYTGGLMCYFGAVEKPINTGNIYLVPEMSLVDTINFIVTVKEDHQPSSFTNILRPHRKELNEWFKDYLHMSSFAGYVLFNFKTHEYVTMETIDHIVSEKTGLSVLPEYLSSLLLNIAFGRVVLDKITLPFENGQYLLVNKNQYAEVCKCPTDEEIPGRYFVTDGQPVDVFYKDGEFSTKPATTHMYYHSDHTKAAGFLEAYLSSCPIAKDEWLFVPSDLTEPTKAKDVDLIELRLCVESNMFYAGGQSMHYADATDNVKLHNERILFEALKHRPFLTNLVVYRPKYAEYLGKIIKE